MKLMKLVVCLYSNLKTEAIKNIICDATKPGLVDVNLHSIGFEFKQSSYDESSWTCTP